MTGSRFLKCISLAVFLFITQASGQQRDALLVKHCVDALTDVMVHDITSPPVASRDYVYPLLAFYEAASPGYSKYKSFAGKLNGLGPAPLPKANLQYDWMIAGSEAFYKTGLAFLFSKDLFQSAWDSIKHQLNQRNAPEEVVKRSIQYGDEVATYILNWAKQDNYIHTRTLPRFTPGKKPGMWQPTGPDFMEAIEPYWGQIRPMTLTKVDQYMLPPPAPFDSEKFAAQSREVYETTMRLTDEQKAEAAFWDCNPFATQTVGHLMYSIKKISPGGHWIGITGIAIENAKLDLPAALYAYSLVSVAVFDVIIAAWDEKYKSNYIRPITAIQHSIAPEWQPALQTPPFPEYVSGHSVISMASATVLTSLFGDHFKYTDNIEQAFGLPARSFESFTGAAKEAAMSRLYGGIHFREAIENGLILGKNVGTHVLERVK